jgi:hypothetical protein
MMSEVIEIPAKEELDRHFSAMGDSVDLINAIVAGTRMQNEPAKDRQDCIKRNVEHLELMIAKGWFTGRNLTAINAAIAAGKSYQPT